MKYKLLKDINYPFGKYSAGICLTLYEWLDEFGLDYLSQFERQIEDNPEWFEARED